MARPRIPAVFMRGGTSKGVFFKASDLPCDEAERHRIFLEVIGSPDPYGRQLNGMGGGYSSVSKVVVLAPSARNDADVDYTFYQIAVDQAVCDASQTCGNLSAAVGPFAVEEGWVTPAHRDGEATVRVYNTNTDVCFLARFPVRDGLPVEAGDAVMSGVAGSGARVLLDYLSPGGGVTGALLPTAAACDTLTSGPDGDIAASMVDATSPVVFVRAADVGLMGTEAPDAIDAMDDVTARLERVRRLAAQRMGLAHAPEDAPLATPKIAVVSPPAPFTAIDGSWFEAESHDIAIRIMSMGRAHKAVTGTGGMCLAAACRITGTIPAELTAQVPADRPVRIATPSGVMAADASVRRTEAGLAEVTRITVERTQRRLMDGCVCLTTSA